MANIWIKKVKSFREAQEFETSYYLSYSGNERIEAMQILRETHFKHTALDLNENGKRLRRVLSISKRA